MLLNKIGFILFGMIAAAAALPTPNDLVERYSVDALVGPNRRDGCDIPGYSNE